MWGVCATPGWSHMTVLVPLADQGFLESSPGVETRRRSFVVRPSHLRLVLLPNLQTPKLEPYPSAGIDRPSVTEYL